MHVLITGGAGFIGSHLAEALLAKGSLSQAAEFNRLAGMYLETARWAERLEEQRGAIAASGRRRM